ncbi:hypothetical protein [Neorhizobium alkalisoli]|uniref:Uncharacterized protein n=1 Tax=Neorhizobium alkalisoli TaxID=528178 RepID=A0A561QIT6_9HYPH|nr:hypothetical protein [Neorhizobium alkalisoli]TWF50256.1 hypothetical protein FHW37_106218 [Neorhizobium alkalisoli]
MIANRMKSVLVAAAIFAAFTVTAEAGDGFRHGGRGHNGGHSNGPHRVISSDFRGATLSGNHHRSRFVENRRFDRQGDGHYGRNGSVTRTVRSEQPSGFNGNSRSFFRQRDTYVGALQAYSIPGNGTYFVRDDDYWPAPQRRANPIAPRAKIIDVEQAMGGNAVASATACSFEAGVCVIRGN